MTGVDQELSAASRERNDTPHTSDSTEDYRPSAVLLAAVLDDLSPTAVLDAVRDADDRIVDFVWRYANLSARTALAGATAADEADRAGGRPPAVTGTSIRSTPLPAGSVSDEHAVEQALRRVVATGAATTAHLPWPDSAAPFGAPVLVRRFGDGVLLSWAPIVDPSPPDDPAPASSSTAPVDVRPIDRTPHRGHGAGPVDARTSPFLPIIDGVGVGLVELDGARQVRFANARAGELLTSSDGTVAPGVVDLESSALPEPVRTRWVQAIDDAVERRARTVFDIEVDGGGARRWVRFDVSPAAPPDQAAPAGSSRRDGRSAQPAPRGCGPRGAATQVDHHTVAAITDVTDRVEAERALAAQARRDPLTGLDNRSEVLHDLRRALAGAARSGRPVGLVAVDLDGFKYVNDAFGHHVGDELLVAAAERLRHVVRGGDLLSRTGGDEFVVIARDLRRAADVVRGAWRIVEAFRRPFELADVEVGTTASVGVVVSAGSDAAEVLLARADAAVYAAKARGRDTVATFDAVLQADVDRRQRIEGDLQSAFDDGQLHLWYQPTVRIGTGEVTGAEALLRWQHPDGEVWDAGSFIDVAEDAGLLAETTVRLLERACGDAAGWPSGADGRGLALQVNLSRRQVADPHLTDHLRHALRTSGLEPDRLCVEIAETALTASSRPVVANLQGIHDLGVSLAFDNFGSGYASLTQLQEYPVDVVKLDRSHTTAVVESERARNVAAGTLAAAERLGLGVVADGVETERQAAVLAKLGYRYAQGHLWSAATPSLHDVTAVLSAASPPDTP